MLSYVYPDLVYEIPFLFCDYHVYLPTAGPEGATWQIKGLLYHEWCSKSSSKDLQEIYALWLNFFGFVFPQTIL